jgi:hypothetical protein
VVVHIHTTIFASEITWKIDGGSEFGPYDNYSDLDEVLQLSAGAHSFNAFDSYGDGWHGGYWQVSDDCGTVMAGGANAGQITGYGGEFALNVGDTAVACSASTGGR